MLKNKSLKENVLALTQTTLFKAIMEQLKESVNPEERKKGKKENDSISRRRYSITKAGQSISDSAVPAKHVLFIIINHEAPAFTLDKLVKRYAGINQVTRGAVISAPLHATLPSPMQIGRYKLAHSRTSDGQAVYVFTGWRTKKKGSENVEKTPEEAPGNFLFLKKRLKKLHYKLQ